MTALTNVWPPATGSLGSSPPEIARVASSATSSAGRPRRAARVLQQPLDRLGEQRPRAHADHRGADQLDLEALGEVAILRAQPLGGGLQHLDRPHRLPGELQQARQLERRLGRLARVARQRDRLLEVLGRRRRAGPRLRPAELREHLRAAVVGRRLAERALEVPHGGRGVAERERPPRRLAQDADHPLLPARLRREDLRRDLLWRALALREQPRRPRVQVGALERRHVVVDRGAHDRVDEAQRLAGGEHLVADEQRGGLVRVAVVEASERGGGGQVGAVPEDRDRPRQRHGPRRQAPEAQQHDARDPARPQRRHALRLGRRRGDALRGDLAQQLAHQQRVAARRDVAGVAERRVGVLVRRLADPAAYGLVAERRGAQRLRERVGDELGEDRAQRLVARARADDDEDRQVLEPAHEEREEPQRRLVRPVGVVDRHEHGLLARDVRGQPVQAVEHRERGVLRARVQHRGGVLEHRPRESRRPGQPRLPPLLVRLVEHRLEELAHDPEREAALELAPAAREHPHPRRPCPPPRARDEAGLADPGGRLEDEEPPGAAPRGLQGRRDPGLLGLALEQPCGAVRHPLILASGRRRANGGGYPQVSGGSRNLGGGIGDGSRCARSSRNAGSSPCPDSASRS
jgi:hypothetical protein